MVYELVEGLCARGHHVTLFTTADSRSSAEQRTLYDRAQWPPDWLADLNHVSWALRQIVAEPFDLVHAHSASVLAMSRLAVDLPIIYTLHHERDERLSAFYRYFPQVHYVAISADQRGREVLLHRCEVVHHGLDPRAFEWTRTSDDYVCFIGRLSAVKGPHTAIDAAAAAGVPIRVAGEIHPPDRPFGEREVIPRLAQPHVQYLGNIGLDTKVPLLRDARALVAPIEWNEPFGLVFIEAMLSGCPVVAYPRGSVPELVEPGITGFIARDRRELVELLRPGSVLDHFDRARCRARAAERFSRARMVDGYEHVYAHALQSAGHRYPRGSISVA